MSETIEWLGEKTGESDSVGLCDSKHRINVGIVKIDGKIIPFESYIVVSFEAMDTEGGAIGGAMDMGGCAMADVAQAYTHYTTTVGEGLADWSRDRGVVYGEGVEGNIAKGVKETGDAVIGGAKAVGGGIKSGAKKVGGGAKKAGGWVGDKTGLWAETDYSFYAEQERQSSPFYSPLSHESKGADGWTTDCEYPNWGEFWGVSFQPESAAKHKVTIKISSEFEGVKSNQFQNQLAGCLPVMDGDECAGCCDMASYGRYYITQPGLWTINITPLASGKCSKPSYAYQWTLEVPKPADWDELVAINPVQAMSTNVSQVLQDAGLPFYLSPVAIVGVASLVGGVLIYKIYKKKKG